MSLRGLHLTCLFRFSHKSHVAEAETQELRYFSVALEGDEFAREPIVGLAALPFLHYFAERFDQGLLTNVELLECFVPPIDRVRTEVGGFSGASPWQQ